MLGQAWWLFFTGITSGCLYAFVALGYVIVYNITGLFNLTAGQFVMLGAMFVCTFYGFGFSLLLSIALALITTSAIGAITWLLFLHRLYSKREPPLSMLLVIAVLSTAFMGIGYLLFGTYPKSLPSFTDLSFNILGVSIMPQSPWIWGGLLITVIGMMLVFDYTSWGKAFRACSEQPLAARLMGVNPNLMALISFILAAFIGAIAGVFMVPLTSASYAMGLGLTLKGFLVFMLGGLTSVKGAVVGGLILGLLESYAGGFISTEFMEVIAIGIVIIVLLFIPEGIFGIKEEKLCRD